MHVFLEEYNQKLLASSTESESTATDRSQLVKTKQSDDVGDGIEMILDQSTYSQH